MSAERSCCNLLRYLKNMILGSILCLLRIRICLTVARPKHLLKCSLANPALPVHISIGYAAVLDTHAPTLNLSKGLDKYRDYLARHSFAAEILLPAIAKV